MNIIFIETSCVSLKVLKNAISTEVRFNPERGINKLFVELPETGVRLIETWGRSNDLVEDFFGEGCHGISLREEILIDGEWEELPVEILAAQVAAANVHTIVVHPRTGGGD